MGNTTRLNEVPNDKFEILLSESIFNRIYNKSVDMYYTLDGYTMVDDIKWHLYSSPMSNMDILYYREDTNQLCRTEEVTVYHKLPNVVVVID